MNAPWPEGVSLGLSRSPLFERHGLVWVPFEALDGRDELEGVWIDWVRNWVSSRPLVVARRSLFDARDRRLRLGLSGPRQEGHKPLRLSFVVDEDAITDYRGALSLEETLQRLPEHEKLRAFEARLKGIIPHPELRVFGSYASSAWASGESFLAEDSDLDILLLPQSRQLSLLDEISRWAAESEACRLDGEIRIHGIGDVAWQEFQATRTGHDRRAVLVKNIDDVGFRSIRLEDIDQSAGIANIAALADEALAVEAKTYLKPGLVSPRDSGSHDDMDYALLTRARKAIRSGFYELARVGQLGGSFQDLVKIGRAMERDMMAATQGVNVYRGAIFNLGLLVAATAYAPDADPLSTVATRYGQDILKHRPPEHQHGTRLRQDIGAGGALIEAASGFPCLKQYVLPAWARARRAGHSDEGALLAALLGAMEHLTDTNILWRGGMTALRDVQDLARTFNARGGVLAADWQPFLEGFHLKMKSRYLSPGGSADLAACAHFVGCWQERHEG